MQNRQNSRWPIWGSLAVVLLAIAIAPSVQAARLGHPAYSASGATASQRQWNLVCDPVGAVSGSTSTLYDPSVAGLNTINAYSGFELTEVDVAYFDGEGDAVQQFVLPAGTTSFVILQGDAAAPASPGSTYYASLDGPEIGAVQVFWAPFQAVVPGAAVKTAGAQTGGNSKKNADVITHTITFDNVSGKPGQKATFSNYANGDPTFPQYFPTPDSYSGPGFSYTAQQIQSATVTLKLKSKDADGGEGDD